jgi:hypothetical protein
MYFDHLNSLILTSLKLFQKICPEVSDHALRLRMPEDGFAELHALIIYLVIFLFLIAAYEV